MKSIAFFSAWQFVRNILVRVILILALGGLLTGCQTVKRAAVNQLGDALASGGTTFAADDDPEIIRAAAPFSLKLMESLLAESPNHRGLLLATASGFTQYGYAFVQQEADELEEKDLAAASALRDRARRLYLRARGYGLRALEATHPGFENNCAPTRASPSASSRRRKCRCCIGPPPRGAQRSRSPNKTPRSSPNSL